MIESSLGQRALTFSGNVCLALSSGDIKYDGFELEIPGKMVFGSKPGETAVTLARRGF